MFLTDEEIFYSYYSSHTENTPKESTTVRNCSKQPRIKTSFLFRDIRLVGQIFFPKLPFPLRGSSPHVRHCSSGQAHLSFRTTSRSVQPFLYGPKCYAVQHIVNGKENPQNCPLPLGFRHPAASGLIHGHKQHPQKFCRNQTCRSGDRLSWRRNIQRDTQTY